METKQWTFVDRSNWPKGPWNEEPFDKIQWQDETTGLPCMARRNPQLGFWCGYVGVTKDHPAFQQHYSDVHVSVHGGLTFSDHCEPANVWWLGFDCGHSWDDNPYFAKKEFRFRVDSTYKTLAFVQEQCRELARQLKELS